MFTWVKPSDESINQYLAACSGRQFTYQNIGMTIGSIPPGFDVDHHRVCLGTGPEIFNKAKDALQSWKMFPPAMAELFWPDAAIEKGSEVAVLFRAGVLWSLNPCRIVDVIEEHSDWERFGFAYGTLEGHLEYGEERFLVEWNHSDDRVWYDLLAASKPGHMFARIGYPIVRLAQRRFRNLSGKSMQDAVS